MAKDQGSKNVTVQYTVPVFSAAGEQVGVFKGAALPEVGADWRGEAQADFPYTVTASSQERIEVAPKASDASVKVAPADKPVDPATNPTVEGSSGSKDYVTVGSTNPLRDPFQNVIFEKEPKPSKLTPWVDTQVKAGLLREAVPADYSDADQRAAAESRLAPSKPAPVSVKGKDADSNAPK